MASKKKTLTPALRAEYLQLWKTCVINQGALPQVEAQCSRILRGMGTYTAVVAGLPMPACVLGAIHEMESDCDFTTHLHNGDPLTARTVQVPAGRPVHGAPPFTWAESALDALRYQNLHTVQRWDIAATLYNLEAYNGFGYRNQTPPINSPYLWSGSTHYTRGLYVKDGKFSRTAVSKQIGVAVLLLRLAQRGAFSVEEPTIPAMDVPGPIVRYSAKFTTPEAVRLQQFLNTFPGVHLLTDGKPATLTSDAFHFVFGRYLAGDPRNNS